MIYTLSTKTWYCKFYEMSALTLTDLNFQANKVSITKTLLHKSGSDIVGPPKTDNGIRTITMPEAIINGKQHLWASLSQQA